VKGIADTGFLVAFVSRNDRHHDWAVSLAEDQTEPLLTCESVVSETAFHLGSSAAALALVSQQLVELAFECNKHIAQLAALAKRYSDRNPDLADLCLIRMSELYPRHKVITTDREDFSVYRRNKREFIPLVCPPEKTP
jgi:predicted nucleic acid-binding protein